MTRQSAASRDVETTRRPDARSNDTQTPLPDTAGRAATTDVDRAHQRLAQEAARSDAAAVATPEQARNLIAQLRQQLADDPGAALRAVAQATDTLYEAATARPTA